MMDIDRSAFGPDTTTDEVVDGLDLSDLSVLITGASGGLGAETARALASKGASVVITARDLTKASAAVDAIKASTGNDDIEIEQLELGSLASIRGFGERWVDGHDTLDILINNAGVMACPQGTTDDGFERQFGTNHLGHFLLTGLVAPTLVATDQADREPQLRGHQRDDVHRRVNFDIVTLRQVGRPTGSQDHNVLRSNWTGGCRTVSERLRCIRERLDRPVTLYQQQDFSPQCAGRRIDGAEVGAAAQRRCTRATAPKLDGMGGIYPSGLRHRPSTTTRRCRRSLCRRPGTNTPAGP
jgi:NAD(P)-dependent dehydrogenase (short-subunit alcohol dehydrogenase family)